MQATKNGGSSTFSTTFFKLFNEGFGTEGDRITIIYNLSEAENRQHHISIMESNASSARTTAALYASQALSATKTEYTYDSEGKMTGSHQVPDYAARASYALMSANALSEANDYDNKARDARAGGPVPTYDLDKVVDSKTGTSNQSKSFVQERIQRGGKILTVDRLPVEKFTAMKGILLKARGGIFGAVVGAGAAVEEIVAGKAAQKINERKSGVSIKSGYTQ